MYCICNVLIVRGATTPKIYPDVIDVIYSGLNVSSALGK